MITSFNLFTPPPSPCLARASCEASRAGNGEGLCSPLLLFAWEPRSSSRECNAAVPTDFPSRFCPVARDEMKKHCSEARTLNRPKRTLLLHISFKLCPGTFGCRLGASAGKGVLHPVVESPSVLVFWSFVRKDRLTNESHHRLYYVTDSSVVKIIYLWLICCHVVSYNHISLKYNRWWKQELWWHVAATYDAILR